MQKKERNNKTSTHTIAIITLAITFIFDLFRIGLGKLIIINTPSVRLGEKTRIHLDCLSFILFICRTNERANDKRTRRVISIRNVLRIDRGHRANINIFFFLFSFSWLHVQSESWNNFSLSTTRFHR